jgi:hypothetical protein
VSEKSPTFRRSAIVDWGQEQYDGNSIPDPALRDAMMRALARMEALGLREITLKVREL